MISFLSTLLTCARRGPLLIVSTNVRIVSAVPSASPSTCFCYTRELTSVPGVLGSTYLSVSGVLHPAFQAIFRSTFLRKVAGLSVSCRSPLPGDGHVDRGYQRISYRNPTPVNCQSFVILRSQTLDRGRYVPCTEPCTLYAICL